MIKRAMILAAGFGKRIQPLTLTCPKPLLKIGDKTLLFNTLIFLENLGIKEVVINVHYLQDQIINYVNKNKFNMIINISKENDKILDTGGGILNTLNSFSDQPFLVINPDTIWNKLYINEIKLMEKFFFEDIKKCCLLVVNKNLSFDKSFAGDFNLKNNLISRKDKNKLDYIYTGLQIIKPDIFSNFTKKVFSINEIWDHLIQTNNLYGIESKLNFLHISNLQIYKKLLKKLNV